MSFTRGYCLIVLCFMHLQAEEIMKKIEKEEVSLFVWLCQSVGGKKKSLVAGVGFEPTPSK